MSYLRVQWNSYHFQEVQNTAGCVDYESHRYEESQSEQVNVVRHVLWVFPGRGTAEKMKDKVPDIVI